MEIEVIKPSVYLVSADEHPTERICNAAKTCYQGKEASSYQEQLAFCKALIKSGHGSPLEFANVTFIITCDRGVSHELVRHRVGVSYNQLSQRYVDYTKHPMQFVMPSVISEEHKPFMIHAFQQAADKYEALRANGYKAEIARAVLPNATATTIRAQYNLRSLRHLFGLRGDMAAHPDIRITVNQMYNVLPKEWQELTLDSIVGIKWNV